VINIDTTDGKRVDVPPAFVEKAPSAIVRRVLEEGGQLIRRRQPYDFSPEAVPFGDTSRPSASLVYVPIHRGEKIIGILSIQSYTPDAYNQQTLNTLQTMADQCGGALERVRAEENVRQLNEGLEQRVRERTVQLEAARQELQDFIDGMSTLNAKVALDGTLLLVNKTAQLASGLPLDKLLKINFLEGSWWTFDPKVQTRVRKAFQKACQGETINYEEKLFVFGRIIDISFSLVPVRGADGQIGYIVAEGRDITALKRTEKSLAERTGQLEAANKELEAFSYSVSHDLRAPLRHIDGFADMLRKESSSGLDAAGQRYLGIISNAAKRMGALIDDLLVFSRMGRAELRRGPVNMDQLVAETLHDLVRDLEGRRIAWDISPLPEVSGDRAMLKQVWANLLSNAVKYTRHREQAAIRIGSRKNGKEEWEFSIQDNGAGFDMKYADKLFGVFQRLHQVEEFEGTGIGLANVRRIILRHGGRTWAESKVDAGATFYFTLPVRTKE
jgi:PAS domain S-box-containing protein